MKTARLWIALLCILLVASMVMGQTQPKPLSNDEVIQMVSLGLSDDVIIEKIHTAPTCQICENRVVLGHFDFNGRLKWTRIVPRRGYTETVYPPPS